jgi:hypothetical protein
MQQRLDDVSYNNGRKKMGFVIGLYPCRADANKMLSHFQHSRQRTCHLQRTGATAKAVALGSKCLAVTRFAKNFLVDGEQDGLEARR